jgi:hypothetical protein
MAGGQKESGIDKVGPVFTGWPFFVNAWLLAGKEVWYNGLNNGYGPGKRIFFINICLDLAFEIS